MPYCRSSCLLGWLGLLLLAGCATPSVHPGEKVAVAAGVRLVLPTVQPFGAGLHVLQLVRIGYGGHETLIQTLVTTDVHGLSLIATLPTGPRIMSLTWRDGQITSKLEPGVPARFSADHLLADLITLYASPSTVSEALEGATLEERTGKARLIRRGETPVIRTLAPGWIGTSTLDNLSWGYHLVLMGQNF